MEGSNFGNCLDSARLSKGDDGIEFISKQSCIWKEVSADIGEVVCSGCVTAPGKKPEDDRRNYSGQIFSHAV